MIAIHRRCKAFYSNPAQLKIQTHFNPISLNGSKYPLSIDDSTRKYSTVFGDKRFSSDKFFNYLMIDIFFNKSLSTKEWQVLESIRLLELAIERLSGLAVHFSLCAEDRTNTGEYRVECKKKAEKYRNDLDMLMAETKKLTREFNRIKKKLGSAWQMKCVNCLTKRMKIKKKFNSMGQLFDYIANKN